MEPLLSGDSSDEAKLEFQKQLLNSVRKCPKCFKSCGDTMVLCGCGFDISNVRCTYTIMFSCLFVAFRNERKEPCQFH